VAPSSSLPSDILRVGVVGLGYAGTTHLTSFTGLPNVEVVALAGVMKVGEQLGVAGDECVDGFVAEREAAPLRAAHPGVDEDAARGRVERAVGRAQIGFLDGQAECEGQRSRGRRPDALAKNGGGAPDPVFEAGRQALGAWISAARRGSPCAGEGRSRTSHPSCGAAGRAVRCG